MLTAETFNETFLKIYGKNSENLHIFKIAHGMTLLGDAAAEQIHRIIGIGIAPDTFIGIRFCEDDCFYLRETDSEIMYECKKSNLSEYNDMDWAANIFHLIGHFILSINISGAQILFHKECGAEFADYAVAVCYGFSNIFCKNLSLGELLGIVLPHSADFSENAKKLISFSSSKKGFLFVENLHPFYLLPMMEDKKIILILIGKRCFGKIEEKEYKDFVDNEIRRILNGGEALKKGDLSAFGKNVKESAQEYLTKAKGDTEKIEILFSTVSQFSDICGLYKKDGIFAFVNDNCVDEFVNKVSEEYEKKAGEKPEFYICAPSVTCRTEFKTQQSVG